MDDKDLIKKCIKSLALTQKILAKIGPSYRDPDPYFLNPPPNTKWHIPERYIKTEDSNAD